MDSRLASIIAVFVDNDDIMMMMMMIVVVNVVSYFVYFLRFVC